MIAPLVFEGAINGDLFVAYVRTQLVPALQKGDIVVLDNLSSHRRIEAKQVIELAGATMLFLPPYSPDLNPIENAFSKYMTATFILGGSTVTDEQRGDSVAAMNNLLSISTCSY